MAEKKLSKELRHCLEKKECLVCDHWESETLTTCKGLLQKAYEVVKRYEEMEDRNRKMLDELTEDCCCELRQLKDYEEDKKNER